MEDNREMTDYLKEIRDLDKKRVFWARITAALMLVFVILIGCMVPTAIKTMNVAQSTMANANDALNQAEDIMSDITVTMDSMEKTLASITKLVDDTSTGMVEAFDNINSIDFEGLNEAITDLQNVVEPLSKFFGKFK